MRLKITHRPYNAGGPGGQHQNKTLSAMEVSVTLPDGRVIRAKSSTLRSQYANKRRAEKVLMARVRVALEPVHEDRRSAERVRTYHAVDNRVVDHASGERRSYTSVMDGDGFEQLVDARRAAKAAESACR